MQGAKDRVKTALLGEEQEEGEGERLIELQDFSDRGKHAKDAKKEEQEVEEDPKAKLIREIGVLQATMHDLTEKVVEVEGDRVRLGEENQVGGRLVVCRTHRVVRWSKGNKT